MENKTKHSFFFDEFEVDTNRRLLLKKGETVGLNPKTLDLLLVLIENQERVVSKNELLDAVWTNQFVEENNLTVHIAALRKALGEKKNEHRFIVTVPGKGYSFAAKVEKIDNDPKIIIENHSFSRIVIEEDIAEESSFKTLKTKVSDTKNVAGAPLILPVLVSLSLAAAVLVGLLVIWFWNKDRSVNANQFNLTKLTMSGKVTNATLTPDSKYAVFAQTENEGESLWLKHIATGSQNQILTAKPVLYVGLAIAPDGNTIYATIFSPALSHPQIWRVPLLGGAVEEINGITTGSAITFSPDGRKIAFIESHSSINENHLLISEASGANKKILVRAKGEVRSFSNFGANPVAWSPDGSEVACAVNEKNDSGVMRAGILVVNPADGSERFISEERWDYVEHLTWTDAENLAFVAYTLDPWQGQVWTVSKQTGEIRRITNDTNSYSWLASADGNLLTVQKNTVSHISIGDFDEKNNLFEVREIYKESGLIEHAAWGADGAVLYSSGTSGKREIWRVEDDGSNPVQLTAGANALLNFAVSPVDGSIVFCSTENGKHSLKLASADGKNVRPLTEGVEDIFPNFTPDGQAVIFQRGFKDKLITLWRVALSDKTLSQITYTHGIHPAISPDGMRIAYYFMDAETDNLWRIRLISAMNGASLGNLSFPRAVNERQMRWHPNGRYIGQIFYQGEKIKLLLLPADGSNSRNILDLGKGNVNNFEWTRDGKRIVVSHTTETDDVVFLLK